MLFFSNKIQALSVLALEGFVVFVYNIYLLEKNYEKLSI